MSGRIVALVVAALVSTTTAHAQQSALRWGPAPPSLPAGARMAVVSGNPNAPGPFTIRLDLPSGFTVAPHFHPVDEHQTLISGRIGHGMGDTIDEKSVKWLRPGQSVTLPANAHHYVRTRGRTLVSVSAMGPFKVTYVNPRDDPRERQ
ncbi:MAG TPA: cupin domain-containing protein [Gemmatimonadaceae bacterium]|nr:cupin domain-containing protein [Gemmatimonadaceae bacterium]